MGILKKTMLASIGAFELTREKAEQVIDDLIKRGELDQSSRKEAIMELLGKAEQSASELGAKVTEAAKELKPAKEQDLRKLEDRLNALSKRVEQLQQKFDSAKDQSKT
jgi:polyhydroxyalkanoate synthesis regulator phasin